MSICWQVCTCSAKNCSDSRKAGVDYRLDVISPRLTLNLKSRQTEVRVKQVDALQTGCARISERIRYNELSVGNKDPETFYEQRATD